MTDRTIVDLYRHDLEAPRSDHYVHWTLRGRRSFSTEEFFRRSWGFSDALAELGVGPGDRVMLLSENRPEWHLVDLAVQGLGAVDVPIYSTLSPEQIAYQATDSGSVVAVVDGTAQCGKFLDIQDRCPDLRHIIQIEGGGPSEVLDFSELSREASEGAESRFWDRAASLEEADLATIIYTSGTTGEPKGVMLSHRNLVQNATFTNRRLPGGPDDLSLSFLPLCHTAERLASYCYMQRAFSRAYCSPEEVGELIAGVAPTIFFAVPRVYEKVYQRIMERVESSTPVRRKLFAWALERGKRANDLRIRGALVSGRLALSYFLADRLVLGKIRDGVGGRVRLCITGAAPVPGFVADFFHSVGIPLADAYGLTETSPVMVLGSVEPGEVRPGWVGRALDNLEVKLAEDGEILVKGPSVMMGYWNKPDATEEAFDEDGFFMSGDVGEMDDEGYIRIVDRKKDLIVTSGGKNVAPQPIENSLKQSPLVDTAVVVGDGRNFIAAVLSPAMDEVERLARDRGVQFDGVDELLGNPVILADFQDVVDRVNGKLARFERVRAFRLLPEVLSIEGGHLTPTLKVKRSVFQKRYSELIEDIYAR
jgi:long-chain acyl-CoA synthetase